MLSYTIRRLLFSIPVLFGITLITFGIMHLAPGKPTDALTDMNVKVTAQARERLIKLYGLDQPWPVQYARWLKRIIRLDFGRSFRDDRPVISKISERLPATLLLNGCSLFLILIISIPLGVLSALKRNSLLDKGLTVFVFTGYSVPTFWLALLLMIAVGIKLGCLPISGLRSLDFDELPRLAQWMDMAKHLVLPVFVMAFTSLAGMSRYVRNEMLEVIHQDYIRAARARGLSERRVIFKHALGNTLIPVVTILGLSLPDMIGGSFIFETIFAYPGMGRLGYDAIMARDYPVLMGIGVIVAFLTLIGNFLADILYALADPRIRYR